MEAVTTGRVIFQPLGSRMWGTALALSSLIMLWTVPH